MQTENDQIPDYQDLVKRVFSNPSGNELLNMWKLMFGTRISYSRDASSDEVAFREGERSFYQSIEDMLNE